MSDLHDEDINTRTFYFLVILIIVIVWYGLVPLAGIFFTRRKWRQFRNRFTELGLSPLLNYREYNLLKNKGGTFRFTGEIESITDGRILWVKGEDLTIPVSLDKTKCFLLPKHEENEIPETPEQIRWNRVSTLTEGVKVFIGGMIDKQNNRFSFTSTKENPLIVIFYNCHETELTSRIIQAARVRNEYWNSLTPASLVIGVLSLVFVAASLLNRPAFRLNVISTLVAVFIPILPFIPPGLLLTNLHRRMLWYSRKFKAYWDISHLPLRYLEPGQESASLASGEKYGFIKLDSLPLGSGELIPYLLPESPKETEKNELYFFGILDETETMLSLSGEIRLPKRSKDPFVSYGILPAKPSILRRRYAIRAYFIEALAWLVLLLGICINIVFIMLVILLLGGLSF